MGKVAKVVLGGIVLGALSVFTFGLSVPVLGGLAAKIGVATGMHLVAAGAIAGGLLAGSLFLFKPKLPSLSTEFGREIQLNGDPVAPRKICYGEAWTAGTLRYRATANTDNKDLYMVIVLAGHEIESVEAVEADSAALTLDGGGDVTSPSKYAGLMNIRFYLGTDDQTADSTLDSTFAAWTSDHRLRGAAYAIVKLSFDEEDLNAIPQFRFQIRGRKVYDPRLDSTNGGTGSHRLNDESTWEWTDNAALCAVDFLMSPKVNSRAIAGLRVDSSRIDWANVIAEANVCDESVNLNPSGTQARYTTNGFIDPRQDHGQNIRHFEVAMAGDITFSDGKWRCFAGAYRTPTLHLQPEHFIGPLKHLVHKGESARFDTAQGVYASAQESGSVLDYPPVRLSTATTGEERLLQLDLALVNNSPQAQRCAKILLEREAAGKQITCTTSLYGYRAVPGETIQITHAAFGLSAQAMRVIDVQLTTVKQGEDKIGLAVELILEAGPSSLYSWDAEETVIETAPDVDQGQVPGAGGTDGNSSIVASVYRRASSAPSTPTADDGSYNFSTQTLTAPSGWSATPPTSDGNPLYVSTGIFEISGTSGTDETVTWSTPAILVQDGATGATGDTGATGSSGNSSIVVTVYRRASSAPSTPTTDDGSYNFTTKTITPPSGWSAAPPASDGNPLYASTGIFEIAGTTGTDETVTWSTPAILVTDGADGAPGDEGSAGTPGTSSIVASVYRRASSAPSTPTADDGSYNFSTRTLTPPSGWSATPPAIDGNPLYVSVGIFEITGTTGTDETVTWTSPAVLVTDGVSAVNTSLTNPSPVVAAASDGTGYSLSLAGGTHQVFQGASNVTTSSVHSIVGGSDGGANWTKAQNGLTLTVVEATGVYSLSGGSWTSDAETFTIRATYNSVNYDKTFAITKAKAGGGGPAQPVQLQITDLSDFAFDPDDAEVGYSLSNNGKELKHEGYGVGDSTVGDWLISGLAADYESRLTVLSGNNPSSGTTATWQAQSTTRVWLWTVTSPGNTLSGSYRIDVRHKETQTIHATKTFAVTSNLEI